MKISKKLWPSHRELAVFHIEFSDFWVLRKLIYYCYYKLFLVVYFALLTSYVVNLPCPAGCNGSSRYPVERNFCCEPCDVDRDFCGVLCAYNACLLGQLLPLLLATLSLVHEICQWFHSFSMSINRKTKCHKIYENLFYPFYKIYY